MGDLHGTVIIAKYNGREDFVDMTDAEIEWARQWLTERAR
jgi:hypothetical protein